METGEAPRPDITNVIPVPEDARAFLLCTDGCWEHVQEEYMMRCLRSTKSAAEWLSRMETEVLHNGVKKNRGHMDNYTGIAIRI
jgi:serine/threonine protein phosphatase PrpC